MLTPVSILRIAACLLAALVIAGCTRAPQADGNAADGNGGRGDAASMEQGRGDGRGEGEFAELIQRAVQAAQADEFAAAGEWLGRAEALLQKQEEQEVLEAGSGQGSIAAPSGSARDGEDAGAGSDATSPDPGELLAQTRAQIEHLRRTRIARLHVQGVLALAEYGGIARAGQVLQDIERIAVGGDIAAEDLRQRIEWALHYGAFGPGQMFVERLQDGGSGPKMAVIAHGEFQLGAVDGDAEALPNEAPPTPVRFERGFALAVFEVSVGEFARFIEATGYQTRAQRRGFSMVYDERSGNFVRASGVDWRADYLGHPADSALPVLHVSARDARAYADWLSVQTGAAYRLPSEAEFEYALRAGGASVYPWPGAEPPPGAGNLTGSEDRSPSGRTWANAFSGYGDGHWGPAPVGSFSANAFGLHDLAGNLSEWVADCWHANYRRAPRDGSAWVNPGCRDQVIRGGSWASSPAQTRASWRAPAPVDTTNARIGFRVARTL